MENLSKLESFKIKADMLTSQFQDLIDELPFKGLKCENSQQVCLQQTLNTLERQIDSLTEEDFKEN